MSWVRVCTISELDEAEILRCDRVDPPIAVTRCSGDIVAFEDTCTHGAASLSEGELEDEEVICPWHLGRFSIRTGEATELPCWKPIKIFQTRAENGTVFVDLDEPKSNDSLISQPNHLAPQSSYR